MSIIDTTGFEPGSTRSRAPIVTMAFMSLVVAVWCIMSANLSGVAARNLPMLLCGALLAFLSAFDVRVGLAALLLAIGLSPEFKLYGIDNFRYEDFIFPVIFLIWFSSVVLSKEKMRTSDLKSPILIIVFMSLISSLSNHIYYNLDLRSAALRFGKSVEYYFMMVLVLNTMRSLRDVRVFAILMVVASAMVGLYGMIQFVAEGGHAAYRLPGPPGETANILGGYFVFHMCLALGLMSKVGSFGKTMILSYLALMALPFVMTMSRTSYVALVVGLVLIWVQARNHTLGWALVLMAAGAMMTPDFVVDRAMTVFQVVSGGEDSSWNARVAGWGWFIPAAMQSPLIGQGIGSRELGAIDSEYVLQLNDLGVVGLLAFLTLVFRCIRTSWRIIKLDDQDPVLSGFMIGYFGGALALMIHSLAATTFTTIRTTEPFFFATGLVYAYWNLVVVKHQHHHQHSVPVHGNHFNYAQIKERIEENIRRRQEQRAASDDPPVGPGEHIPIRRARPKGKLGQIREAAERSSGATHRYGGLVPRTRIARPTEPPESDSPTAKPRWPGDSGGD